MHHKLSGISYPFLYFYKKYIRRDENALRVLLYHDVPPSKFKIFESQIEWLTKRWDFITPYEFKLYVSGKKKLSGKKLLLTFDDGFRSNYEIASSFLDKHGIKAIFFIVSDISLGGDENKTKELLSKNIIMRSENSPLNNICMMGSKELTELLKAGHTIGAHTKTHRRLTEIQKLNELEDEILDSASKLELYLDIKVDDFAYTYGDLMSFNRESFLMANKKFSYIRFSVQPA
jgi:peptidoglycan/xylan/chitin deacetylase (PgdA/CDA1 family)